MIVGQVVPVKLAAVDVMRLGRIVRALRRRRGWRQRELARAAGVSQSMVSLIERGHIEPVAVGTLGRVLAALDARLFLDARWRGGEIERLLDERHASLAGSVIAELVSCGWDVRTEVTYSQYGERGSFDILAWHKATATLLVVEIKSELTSAEATLRKLDEKSRLASIVARQRFGWRPANLGCVLVLGATTADRDRVARHASLINSALPAGSVAVRRWFKSPAGPIRGIRFLGHTNGCGRKLRSIAPQRVRARSSTLVELGDRPSRRSIQR